MESELWGLFFEQAESTIKWTGKVHFNDANKMAFYWENMYSILPNRNYK